MSHTLSIAVSHTDGLEHNQNNRAARLFSSTELGFGCLVKPFVYHSLEGCALKAVSKSVGDAVEHPFGWHIPSCVLTLDEMRLAPQRLGHCFPERLDGMVGVCAQPDCALIVDQRNRHVFRVFLDGRTEFLDALSDDLPYERPLGVAATADGRIVVTGTRVAVVKQNWEDHPGVEHNVRMGLPKPVIIDASGTRGPTCMLFPNFPGATVRALGFDMGSNGWKIAAELPAGFKAALATHGDNSTVVTCAVPAAAACGCGEAACSGPRLAVAAAGRIFVLAPDGKLVHELRLSDSAAVVVAMTLLGGNFVLALAGESTLASRPVDARGSLSLREPDIDISSLLGSSGVAECQLSASGNMLWIVSPDRVFCYRVGR